MFNRSPVTFLFTRPFIGSVREGERTASWEIDRITVNWLGSDQEPPSNDLVFGLHPRIHDENGEEVPVEVLSLFDLEQGLRDACRREFEAAWAAVRAG